MECLYIADDIVYVANSEKKYASDAIMSNALQKIKVKINYKNNQNIDGRK